ncbi:hypothetical protein [Streptosporangium sp. KLBMP 9127]|nr:hypothetical protein [Streptosporangium sp. KLBMP 9127]
MEQHVAVTVEALVLRADHGGGWAYRRLVTTPQRGESPDEAARRLSGVAGSSNVVHSTSWRYRPEGQVVLTYAICPDPAPELPATGLPRLDIARGSSASAPSPEDLGVPNVVAHAIRHLAFLMDTDPIVREALREVPEIAAALDGLSLAPAGRFDPTPA